MLFALDVGGDVREEELQEFEEEGPQEQLEERIVIDRFGHDSYCTLAKTRGRKTTRLRSRQAGGGSGTLEASQVPGMAAPDLRQPLGLGQRGAVGGRLGDIRRMDEPEQALLCLARSQFDLAARL